MLKSEEHKALKESLSSSALLKQESIDEEAFYEDSDNEEFVKEFQSRLISDKAKATSFALRTVLNLKKITKEKVNQVLQQNQFYQTEYDRIKRNLDDMRRT